MNAEAAYPSIQIVCADRTRVFCLNLGGFRAMQEYLIAKSGDPEFSILEDFDWNSTSIENISLMMFGGLYVDAKKDAEPFTIEKAEDVVSLVGVSEARQCIENSLSRAMSPAQFKKLKEEAEKKTKLKAQSKQKIQVQKSKKAR